MIIAPKKMLAMLGGGQLGRYFVMSAHKMGFKVTVLDPDPQSPAGRIADAHLCSAYDDQNALCLLYTSPSPRDAHESRMPSSA